MQDRSGWWSSMIGQDDWNIAGIAPNIQQATISPIERGSTQGLNQYLKV